MLYKRNHYFSNFSQVLQTHSTCFRPDDEEQLNTMLAQKQTESLLARGNGLSYSDCCTLNEGVVIDTSRLNHLLSFDPATGIAVCQGAVTFADLFLLDPAYIPPILPGTIYATLAGGIANDVHGKNNHQLGTMGDHLDWIELQIAEQTILCSRQENSDLFFATIAGLGLTGVIKRISIHLRKTSRFVDTKTERHLDFKILLKRMQEQGIKHDYQVAWLDLLNKPRALLSFADHCEPIAASSKSGRLSSSIRVPKLPIRVLNSWLMKQFNRLYYHLSPTGNKVRPLWQFNNPLDRIGNWNHLYGKKGLLQFQALFAENNAQHTLEKISALIELHKASPMLAVLKYFTRPGPGLLSFVKPGFTIAIDFIPNPQAYQAIKALNQFITESDGRIYLAKDLTLTSTQFGTMYTEHPKFSGIRAAYNTQMHSDLSKRLGLN